MSAWKQTAKKGGEGSFEKAPPGNHMAILVALIDLGEQYDEYGGEGKWTHRAYFVWELVAERMSGSKRNHVIGIDLNVSLTEKAKLRKWIEARTGKAIPDGAEYDISRELGQPCLLNVVTKNDFPKIDSLGALPKGMPVPTPTYPPTLIGLDDFRAGTPVPEWVPYLYAESIPDVIRRSKEMGGEAATRRKGKAEKTESAPASKDAMTSAYDDTIPW